MFLLAIYIYWLIGGPMGLTIIVVWLISLGVMALALMPSQHYLNGISPSPVSRGTNTTQQKPPC